MHTNTPNPPSKSDISIPANHWSQLGQFARAQLVCVYVCGPALGLYLDYAHGLHNAFAAVPTMFFGDNPLSTAIGVIASLATSTFVALSAVIIFGRTARALFGVSSL